MKLVPAKVNCTHMFFCTSFISYMIILKMKQRYEIMVKWSNVSTVQNFCSDFDDANLVNSFRGFKYLPKSNVYFVEYERIKLFVFKYHDIFAYMCTERLEIVHLFRTGSNRCRKTNPSTHIFFVSFSLLDCKSLFISRHLMIEPI